MPFEVGRASPLRAVVWLAKTGAHGVTRPTIHRDEKGVTANRPGISTP